MYDDVTHDLTLKYPKAIALIVPTLNLDLWADVHVWLGLHTH